jgi:DNA-directed RNA polymerase specialized sigma24 family protein
MDDVTRILSAIEQSDTGAPEQLEPVKAELLKLHAFGGLNVAATAEILGISPTTADRWWAYARAWLRTEVSKEKDS